MTNNAGARGGGEGGMAGCGCGCGCAVEGLHKKMKDSRIIDIVVMMFAFSMVELRRRRSRRRRKGIQVKFRWSVSGFETNWRES